MGKMDKVDKIDKKAHLRLLPKLAPEGKIYYLILCLFLCGCSALKKNMIVNGSENDAINNAILDFVHTEKKLLKYDRVFNISTEINKDNIIVTIVGEPSAVSFIIEEDSSCSYRAFPTMLVEANDRLFLWDDETKNVTDTIINTLNKYNLIDTMDNTIGRYHIKVITDDGKRVAHYYFCKNNLSKYKKVITRRPFGYYEPPKLKCTGSVPQGAKKEEKNE